MEDIKNKIDFNKYVDFIPDIILILNSSAEVVFVNEGGAKLLNAHKKEILNKNWIDNFIPDNFRKRVWDVFNKLKSNNPEAIRAVSSFENPVLCVDGAIKTIRWASTVINDEKGRFLSLLTSGQDISSEQQKNIDLEQKELFLRSISDFILVYDVNSNIVYVNDAICSALNYTKKEMLNKKLFEIDTKENAQLINFRIKQLLEKQNLAFESAYQKKDGGAIPLDVHSKIIDIDGKRYILSIGRDISEKKKYEEITKESEEKFKKVSESLFNPLIIMDNVGMVTYWNKAAEKMLGYSAEEALGANLHDLVNTGKYDMANSGGLADFYKTGSSPMLNKIVELEVKAKDGKIIPVELSVSSALLGDKIYAIGSLRDLREKKEAEAKLHEKINELERFNKIMVDRELKMLELKEELKKYKKE